MKVLVINCGSSTVKFQLIETDAELIVRNEDHFLAKGAVEKIGTTEALIRFQRGQDKGTVKVAEVVCAAPCEDACRRGKIDAPISIRALKRFVCERFGPESMQPGTQDQLVQISPQRG